MNEPIEIKVRYIDKEMPELVQTAVGDWIDLRSAEEREYKAGELFRLRLGVAMELPPQYEAHILPRSSTCRKYGVILANSQGIIDNAYKGDNDEWCAELYAIRDGKINRHDRILQFRIVERMPVATFKKVESLGNPDRGGFGSTGTK